jgi:hypothetical protein
MKSSKQYRPGVLCILAILVIAGGCSRTVISRSVGAGADLATLESFAFAPAPPVGTDRRPVDETGLRADIQSAVQDELIERGYLEASASDADFQIRYRAFVRHRANESDLNAGQTDRAGWWGPRADEGYVVQPGVTGVHVQEWDEGTLLIEFIDPQDEQALYSMKAETRVQLYTIDSEERRKRVGKLVEKLMSDVPRR